MVRVRAKTKRVLEEEGDAENFLLTLLPVQHIALAGAYSGGKHRFLAVHLKNLHVRHIVLILDGIDILNMRPQRGEGGNLHEADVHSALGGLGVIAGRTHLADGQRAVVAYCVANRSVGCDAGSRERESSAAVSNGGTGAVIDHGAFRRAELAAGTPCGKVYLLRLYRAGYRARRQLVRDR